jgi:hypothetical protein
MYNKCAYLKRLLVLSAFTSAFVLIIICGEALAQWSTDGSNIYFNSGNVGINSAAPEGRLTVGGDIYIDRASKLRFWAGPGYPRSYIASNNQNDITFNMTDGGYEAMRILWTGNVGIGTSNPTQKLEVNGDVAFTNSGYSGGIHSFPSGLTRIGINMPSLIGEFDHTKQGAFITTDVRGDGNNAAAIFVKQPNSSVETEVLSVLANGNVGIGKTSPAWKLDVANGWVNTDANHGYLVGTAGKFYINNNNRGAIYEAAGVSLEYYNGSSVIEGLVLNSSGNIGIGTTTPQAKLDVAGDIRASGNIGAKYQDVAEWVSIAEKLDPGTVVIMDTTKSGYVTASSKPYDTRVAGVVSATPGIILGESGIDKTPIATSGRVKVKVDARQISIEIGDLLVSTTDGMAMKSEPIVIAGVQIHRPGTIIGKAIEPLSYGTGEILILLSLQ